MEFAYNLSTSAVTGLGPIEIDTGQLPRLTLVVFESADVAETKVWTMISPNISISRYITSGVRTT